MKVLRDLADTGKTILLTIHQPSLEVFRLMDNLVVVARNENPPGPGRVVYYGPAYPDAVQFFNPDGVPDARPGVDPSPDAILRGLSKKKAEEWEHVCRLAVPTRVCSGNARAGRFQHRLPAKRRRNGNCSTGRSGKPWWHAASTSRSRTDGTQPSSWHRPRSSPVWWCSSSVTY